MRELALPIRSSVPTVRNRAQAAGTGLLTGLVGRIAVWLEVHRERRQLLSMSDYMLHDIGLSRADAEGEGTRRFWDVPDLRH
jgi:uncharacterized protein YjiS (DUF1127 family)